jgi:hypothetical protein
MRKKIKFATVSLTALALSPTGQQETYHDLKTNGLQIKSTNGCGPSMEGIAGKGKAPIS